MCVQHIDAHSGDEEAFKEGDVLLGVPKKLLAMRPERGSACVSKVFAN